MSRRICTSLALTIALTMALAGARQADAFPTGEQFDGDPLTTDGGGGIPFDGAPRWQAHTCAVCHTNPPGLIGLRLEADQPELFTNGWKPSQQYHLRVVLKNEQGAAQYQADGDNCGFMVTPYHPCDENGFALEMDDVAGHPTGKFVPVAANACVNTGTPPTDTDVRVLTDGTAVTHNGAHRGLVSWDLCWSAPAAGAGTIVAYISAVDGNGGNGTEAFPQDTIGDDVVAGAVPIPELGATPPPGDTGGCTAGGDPDPLAAIASLALVIAFTVRRRGRRRRRCPVAAAITALALLASCATVRPRQRETLAKRNMKFSPDPTEDELDLHMQESREGSSGGYGSSGGGCGCN